MIRALTMLVLLAAGVRVEGPPDVAPGVGDRVRVLLDEVERGLGFTWEGEALVRLARNDAEFRRMVGEKPDWVVAVALPDRGELVVKLSAVGAGPGTDISAVLRHELVHLLLPARLGGVARVPLWFEEGLAQVLGGRVNRADTAQVAVAAGLDTLIPLASLATSFPVAGGTASLAYAQGESVVTYLVRELGRAGFLRLLDAIRDRGGLDAALRAELGFGERELEERWKAWLVGEEPPWWAVLLSGSLIPVLLFVASLLAVAAFLRARRRARATYDSLPE